MRNNVPPFTARTAASRAVAAFLLASAVGMSFPASRASAEGGPIVVLDDARAAARKPQPGKYPPQLVVPGQKNFDGSFLDTLLFEAADGAHSVRIWESGPGVLQTDGYPHDEYCLVLEGELEITNRAGAKASFGPGDTFVIPKGWQGVWNMKTRFRKQYVVLASAAGAVNN